MECLYHEYVANFAQHVAPNDTMCLAPKREFTEYQQTTNPARFHPYGRRQQPQQPLPRNYDIYGQYQNLFDSTYQPLPATYNDVMINSNLPAASNWYPNDFSYAYPNLDFLHEATPKPGTEAGLFGGKVSTIQTQTLNSQMYPRFGENYQQHPSFMPRRTGAPATIGQTRTRDKYRVVYTDSQKIALEEEYDKSSFITEKRREELAEEISLSERQIKFWFQNRRVKDRRSKTIKTQKQAQETSKPTSTKTQRMTEPKNNHFTEPKNQHAIDVAEQVNLSEQTPTNRPPCRFSAKYSTSPGDAEFETNAHAYNGGALFPASNTTSPTLYGAGYHSQSGMRYPVSPSDWTALSETSLLTTLNVSPILTSVENDLSTRS